MKQTHEAMQAQAAGFCLSFLKKLTGIVPVLRGSGTSRAGACERMRSEG